ncbi:MAG TPA: hypothetical protein VII03_01305, partial [Solirubrobacteraceae bacterium]
MSFFDDGEEETATRPAARTAARPRPRRPQGGAGHGAGGDQHALLVRRRIAAGGVALVFVVIIVLVISGCLKSQKQQSLKDYNREVSQLAADSDTQVSKPLFTALAGASGKSALDVEV